MRILSALFALLSAASLARANTEKTIFSAPSAAAAAAAAAAAVDLSSFAALSPANNSLRTSLASAFPAAHAPHGVATWVVLKDLVPGQRYEVRVCWAATEPAAFKIEVYDFPTLTQSPALLSSLPSQLSPATPSSSSSSSPPSSTAMLLRILTAADYLTANTDLMASPPPVFADVILDAYAYNIVPQSLLPTISVIALVAPLAIVLGRVLANWIGAFAVTVYADDTADKDKTE